MTTENPYAAPVAKVGDSAPDVPEEILKKIKAAWTTAVFVGCITLLIGMLSGLTWALIDVALAFGLAFGIYKKSRTCAVLMFAYFVFSKIAIAIGTGSLIGIFVTAPLVIVFAYMFWQGISGTFAYHKRITTGD